MTTPPRVLAIAGSDSSGGAGIQADIKTITMLGGYAMTAITAVTAQNSTGVTAVETLPAGLVGQQIDACLTDIGADAIKIGMLGSAEIAHLVGERLEGLDIPVVFDPVMVATSGAVLADKATIEAFGRLMRLATVTTPNIPELEALSGRVAGDTQAMDQAAEHLIAGSGARAILAKGGHAEQARLAGDRREAAAGRVRDRLYLPEAGGTVFEHERIDTAHTHGTGCTLSSAIATFLGQGLELTAAVGQARAFVLRALLAAPGFGAGNGPMGHQAVR